MRVAYVHTNFWFDLKGGGCITHTNGVTNAMQSLGHEVLFLGPHTVPGVSEQIPFKLLPKSEKNIHGVIDHYRFNRSSIQILVDAIREFEPDFVYHRAHGRSFAARRAASITGVPMILEFNSSEVWTGQWEAKGRFPIIRDLEFALKRRMVAHNESANLRQAEGIIVVSNVVRDILTKNGVDANRILVNPNGLAADRFSTVNQDAVTQLRSKYSKNGQTIVGFTGTFWQWHGIPEMAEAITRINSAGGAEKYSFIFLGDGVMKGYAENAMGHFENVHFLGLVPNESVPDYLMASDILLSPHVPNRDGSTFFGSPTKLFEYMGAGKAIVASDLEQIGDILEHEKTALLIEPGNIDQLVDSIERLRDDPELRVKLGEAAKKDVMANYTWSSHVQRIIDFAQQRVDSK